MQLKPWIALALSLAAAPAVFAQADNYPSRPVTVIVTANPGGNPDVVARVVSDRLARRLGKPLVVENRPGASGSIGAAVAAKAAPDGYTLAVLESNQIAINPHIYPKLSYSVGKDLVPIAELVVVPTVFAVNASLPVNSLRDFIAYAKSARKELNYGSSGSGSVHHLTMVVFLKATGVKMTHVPYKGSAQIAPALIAGEIDAAFLGIPNIRQLAATGRAKVLAISASERSPAMPTVPTARELGFPDVDVAARLGLFAPAGTPPQVRARLFEDIKHVLAEPAVREKLEALGMSVSKLEPAQYAAALDREAKSVGALVRDLNLKVE